MEKDYLKFEDQIFSEVSDNLTTYIQSIAESQNMMNDLKAISEEKNKIIAELERSRSENELKIKEISDELVEKNERLRANEGDMARLEKLKVDALSLADLVKDNKDAKRKRRKIQQALCRRLVGICITVRS